MQLADAIHSPTATIDDIAELLDAMTSADRTAATQTLNRADQRFLFEKAYASAPLELAHFVPASREDLEPVVHVGRNTLPLPAKHRGFEKRFCRPRGETSRLFGYNESPSRGLIGPGYFVTKLTKDRADWRGRGSIVIDYFEVPDAAVAEGWPEVRPNEAGLQKVVYAGTRDFMRRVSSHVSIGAAYKGDKPLDHYFTLVRQDA